MGDIANNLKGLGHCAHLDVTPEEDELFSKSAQAAFMGPVRSEVALTYEELQRQYPSKSYSYPKHCPLGPR